MPILFLSGILLNLLFIIFYLLHMRGPAVITGPRRVSGVIYDGQEADTARYTQNGAQKERADGVARADKTRRPYRHVSVSQVARMGNRRATWGRADTSQTRRHADHVQMGCREEAHRLWAARDGSCVLLQDFLLGCNVGK